MPIKLLYVESSKESWAEQVTAVYTKKISNFLNYSIEKIKSNTSGRSQKKEKIEFESKKIIERLKPNDFVILCDERGESCSSEVFSKLIIEQFEQGRSNIVFIIGGAFGVSEIVKRRVNFELQLSSFVLNHHMARSLLQEQIYRALCIWKNIPYHNS